MLDMVLNKSSDKIITMIIALQKKKEKFKSELKNLFNAIMSYIKLDRAQCKEKQFSSLPQVGQAKAIMYYRESHCHCPPPPLPSPKYLE